MDKIDKCTDSQLVNLMQKDQVAAFDQLFDRYCGGLFSFALSHLKNREDAEDVVQEVFFRLWQQRKKIPDRKSFKSYLFSIAYHVIVDIFRKKLKDHKYEEYLLKKVRNNVFDTLVNVEYEELNERLNHIIHHLPEKRQKIFLMSRKQGFSHKKIARLLGISPQTVENQINLSLKFIRKQLQDGSVALVFFAALLFNL